MSENSKFNYAPPDVKRVTGGAFTSDDAFQDYLLAQLLALLTQKTNLHGRKVGKAQASVKGDDYVIRRELSKWVTGNLYGTVSARPAPNSVQPGTNYYATDRGVTYIQIGNHWVYKDGVQLCTISTKPSLSVLYDIGYLIYVTDYNWYYRWTGLSYVRMNGTSLAIHAFRTAPTADGWGLCDGSTYTYSKDDGSTGSIVTPDLVTNAKWLKFSGTYASNVTAVTPTILGSTGSSGAHTHETDISAIEVFLPDHPHELPNLESSLALNIVDDATWGITGTVGGGSGSITGSATMGGSLDLPEHGHGLSQLSAFFTTEDENQTHQHDLSGGSSSAHITTIAFANNFYNTTGSGSAVYDVTSTISGSTDTEDQAHDHDFEIDFSSAVTDGVESGPVSIDTSSLTVDTSGLGISGSGFTFTDTSEHHYHPLTGVTLGIGTEADPAPFAIDFTGLDPITSSSDGAHTHTGSSLTISDDGAPLSVSLLPYIRL